MLARMLLTGGMRLGALVPLVTLLLLAGCSHDRDYDRGGGGGGCCRGAMPNSGPTALPTTLSASAPADYSGAAVGGQPAASASTPAKELYGGQKTCPVTGEKLGSMGPAVSVTVRGETIYVCCQGCVGKVQRDPDTHLRMVEAEHAGN